MPSASDDNRHDDQLTPLSSGEQRRRRVPAALFHLGDRHGSTPARRQRQSGGAQLLPHEAVRLAELLAAGTAQYEPDEDHVDADDLLAALTLVPLVRAELDETELALMIMARGRRLTWAQIALGLGLGSAQAAQQRYDRLSARAEPEP